ncbi:hypothetical protein H0A36_07275 [Endozoicomonas sp. SM1973]|uniref:Uncharacterized protein n=1 Tax=Spartinivicinus marinus TaxID=2994442 RepID=A0A853I7B9_9GAMM|nr:hypothetical protein [Spartinivicinus marinus]MCX4025818.1 hypothetical protein [Spartinivicinus marinus]NYZ65811.1 hypothetical protein [Spartinivicinus marinus]
MIKRKDYVAGRRLKKEMQEKLVLSPLPIGSQEQPFDTVGNLNEKTNVYLDVGGGNIHSQIEIVALLITISFFLCLLMLFLLLYMDDFRIEDGFFYAAGVLMIGYLIFSCCILYAVWSSLRDLKKSPFLRFNHQRREVAVPFGKKNSFIIIPWELLYVWVETATVASDTMMASTSILMFTMANPDNEEEFWSGFQLGTGAQGGHEANCVMLGMYTSLYGRRT